MVAKPHDIYAPLTNESARLIDEDFDAAFDAINVITTDIEVTNGDTVALGVGTPVYIGGADGSKVKVLRAQANAASTSDVLGLVVNQIEVGKVGMVRKSGYLTMNTTAFNVGDIIYVSAALAGALTATAPTGTNIPRSVARVVLGDRSVGLVFVIIAGETNHQFLSARHPDTTVASVVRGDVITGQGATASWARLAITATAGRFVRSDGTDVGWSTLALPNAATIGDIPHATASNTYTALAAVAVGNVITSGGVGVASTWGKVNLTTGATQHVTGTLPVANGGTGLSSLGGTGRLICSDGSTSFALVSTAFNNRVLTSQGTTAVVLWSSFAIPTSAVLGDIWYGSDTTTISRLAGNTTTAKNLLTQTGTGTVSAAPVWQALPTAIGHTLLDGSIHTDTTVQTVTRGSLIAGIGATPTWNELVIGAANRVLRSDGTDATWAQVALTTDVTGILPYANGGTNASTAWTAGSVIFAGASSFAQDNAGLGWDDAANSLNVTSQVNLGTLSLDRGSRLITANSQLNITVTSNDPMVYTVFGTEVYRITNAANLTLGTALNPGNGSRGIVFGDGTAFATMGTDTAGLYANDVAGTVEMFAIDEGGTATQISPHNFTLFTPDVMEQFPWSYYSKNEYLGEEIGVDIAKLVRLIQNQTGIQLIYRKVLPTRHDWSDDQELQMRRAMSTYEAWERTDRQTPSPPVPVVKCPPAWLRERLLTKGYLNAARQLTLQTELTTWKTVRGL